MPHITAALSLLDGQATPVARSFVPRVMGVNESIFRYARTAGDTPDKTVNLKVNWSESSPKRPTTRQAIEIAYPVLRTVNGIITVVDTGRVQCLNIIPDSMTDLEIADMIYFAKNAQFNAAIYAGSVQREPIWG